MTWTLAILCLVASVPAGLRWLRVAQREHYLAPSVMRFAFRWWSYGVVNRVLCLFAVAGLVGSLWVPLLAFLVPLAQIGPIGLSVTGRTSTLTWTPRLLRLGLMTGLMLLIAFVVGGIAGSSFVVALGLFLLPVLVDLALVLLGPVERRLGRRWVEKAAARLNTSGAKVVAITGSYGKTTTKQYLVHLLSGVMRTVASPASFNNRMGLARAINEGLMPGTEVFVAEMGTYGPGEISELCEWIPPDVAAIVAIGPVHLERFRTEERILSAKAEILDGARIGVIAVDHPLLAALAEDRAGKIELIEVSGKGGAVRVTVGDGELQVDGTVIGPVPPDVFEVNLAVAVGIGLALGLDVGDIAARLANLPRVEHRQTVSRSERGFSIIDDTFNSNPAGARSGLGLLSSVGAGGRTVVVTPGMVELGPRQFEENRAFATLAAGVVDDLVIVGGTNRRALLEGSAKGMASVTVVGSREEAVDWVRDNLGPGDAVLYENDLPDHYP